MKKFIYAFMFAAAPLLASSLSSCTNEDDLPDVKFNIEVENAQIVDGTIYVVQGDTLNVTSVSVTNQEQGKSAGVTNVKYYINGVFIGASPFAPFPAYGITDAQTPEGKFELGITCTVLAVDKSIAFGNMFYPVKVVASADDIPANGVATDTATMSIKN